MPYTRERARVAALSRHRPADHPELADARREFERQQLDEHIARIVAAAPALSAAQRDKLATLLRPATTSAAHQQGGTS